ETLREGRTVVGQMSLRTKNGHFVAVKLRTMPLRLEFGGLRGAVEIFEEVENRSYEEERHAKLAAFGCLDTATGILNHSMIQAHVHECLTLHTVHPVPLSVLCIAIDGLTSMRERYGQASVDAALRLAAQTLEASL